MERRRRGKRRMRWYRIVTNYIGGCTRGGSKVIDSLCGLCPRRHLPRSDASRRVSRAIFQPESGLVLFQGRIISISSSFCCLRRAGHHNLLPLVSLRLTPLPIPLYPHQSCTAHHRRSSPNATPRKDAPHRTHPLEKGTARQGLDLGASRTKTQQSPDTAGRCRGDCRSVSHRLDVYGDCERTNPLTNTVDELSMLWQRPSSNKMENPSPSECPDNSCSESSVSTLEKPST